MSLFSASENKAAVLLVQHSDQAPGGVFERSLAGLGTRITRLKLQEGNVLPKTDDGFDGLVVLGGPQHAFDDGAGPHFPALMELMRRFDRKEKPVAGICLGCQLLARAWGGAPYTLDFLEFGFIPHRLTPEGERDPVLGGAAPPPLMEFHEDSYGLPDGAALLVEGEKCPNQCFKIGNASYGFQFHLEVDLSIVNKWIHLFRNGQIDAYKKYKDAFDAGYFEDITSNILTYAADSQRYCEHVARRWLALTLDGKEG